jgi:biopolymer transport protein ExbB
MLDELFIRGGPVLYILFGLTFIIFALLIEKYIFIFIKSNDWVSEKLNDFLLLNPPSKTKHKFVESTLISNIKRKTSSNIKTLDGLIGMCPMIGLLGTVYGMIEVFEVLSFMGTGNPRAMSSGVAKATIPTMAGMVITLFGLYFRQDLNQRMDKIINDLRDSLKTQGYQL